MTDVQVVASAADEVELLRRQEELHKTQVEMLRAEVMSLKQQVGAAQEWKDVLVADAHTYADEHELCEAFDEFMTEHGLPPRKHEWNVDVRVTATVVVTVTVKATHATEAMDVDKIDKKELTRLVGQADSYDIEVGTVEALEAERSY